MGAYDQLHGPQLSRDVLLVRTMQCGADQPYCGAARRRSKEPDKFDTVVRGVIATLRGPGQHLLPGFRDFLPAAKREWFINILRWLSPAMYTKSPRYVLLASS